MNAREEEGQGGITSSGQPPHGKSGLTSYLVQGTPNILQFIDILAVHQAERVLVWHEYDMNAAMYLGLHQKIEEYPALL